MELGVCTGRSTAHLAAGWPAGEVIGVDIQEIRLPEIQDRFPNIRFVHGSSDSRQVVEQVDDHTVDLCFFDTVHDGEYLLQELPLWLPKMKPQAILLFDDIHMFPSMSDAWNSIELPKMELPTLHYTGFGAAIVP